MIYNKIGRPRNTGAGGKYEKELIPDVLRVGSRFKWDNVRWIVKPDHGEHVEEDFEIRIVSDDEDEDKDGNDLLQSTGTTAPVIMEEEEDQDDDPDGLRLEEDPLSLHSSAGFIISDTMTIDPKSLLGPAPVLDRKSGFLVDKRLETSKRHRQLLEEEEAKFVTSSPEFYCADCNKSFTTHFSLQRHNAVQHGILNKNKAHFRCDACNKVFFCKDELNRHMIKKHNCPNAVLHRCHFCGRLFPSQYELARHRVKIHEPKTIPCQFCDKKFSRDFLLKDHQKRNHKTPFYAKCRTCNEMILQHEMDEHMVKEHPINMQCTYCSKVFLKANLLSRHLNEEHGVSYSCGKCGRNDFTSEIEFADHICSDQFF